MVISFAVLYHTSPADSCSLSDHSDIVSVLVLQAVQYISTAENSKTISQAFRNICFTLSFLIIKCSNDCVDRSLQLYPNIFLNKIQRGDFTAVITIHIQRTRLFV